MTRLFSLTLLCSYVAHGQSSDIARLREEIQAEQQRLNQLLERLDTLEKQQAVPPVAATPAPPKPSPPPAAARSEERDSIGDLNAARVQAGDFPGSIQVPGRDISLAFGGFVKTEFFHDTHSEGRDTMFLPAHLGENRDDIDGNTVLTAELSRVHFDARSTIGESKLRGYIDFDFSGGSDHVKLRHAYLKIDNSKWGQLLAGKYWTNFMDTEALPETVTEPTFSGVIFARQVQLRYTAPLTRKLRLSASVEDSASNDVTEGLPFNTHTAWPDTTASLTWTGERSHLRIGGLWRRYTIDPDGTVNISVTGWGTQGSGHIELGARDRLIGSFVYGKALGRYMLGILAEDGAFLNLDARSLSARKNLGGLAGWVHEWNSPCRSTFGTGYASAPITESQPEETLRASIYGMANYVCSISRYVTIGGEYDYGRRWNKAGGMNDNRFMLGFQIF